MQSWEVGDHETRRRMARERKETYIAHMNKIIGPDNPTCETMFVRNAGL